MTARLFNQVQYAVKHDLLTYQYQAVPTQELGSIQAYKDIRV